MEEMGFVESLLSSLRKPQSCKRLLQILIALRKEVGGPDHRSKIQQIDVNSLKVLVACTQHDANLKVIDLALSILGNCCTNQFVVRQLVHTLNVLDHLNRVLKKHQKDSIQCRVFRILGNLCDGVEPLEIVKKEPAVINSVTHFLNRFRKDEMPERDAGQEEITSTTASNEMTVSMALRFIRKALVRQTFDILVNDHQLIKVIGVLLVKCADMWLLNKNNHLLISDIIKIVQLFSSSAYIYDDIIIELKTAENGDALKSLGDVILLHPEKITKIMLKLGQISRSQSDLPIETIITNLINAVNVKRFNVHNKEYLGCINKLMDHVGFQDKLNRSNNINLLVKLLEDFDIKNDCSVNCCLQICSILNKCKYNDNLVKSQLNSNVILIITEKLEIVTGKASNKINLITHEVKKNPSYKNVKRFKFNKPENDLIVSSYDSVKGYDTVYNRPYCASPSSSSEISSCGPFSPSSSTRALCNDSGSENYSPLCSEDEGDEEIKLSIPDDDLILSETEDHKPIYSQDQMELRCKLRDEMNLLLKFYCTVKPMYQHLGNPKLITLLINLVLDPSINEEHGDLAYSIIISIAQTREFLIPLMVSGIIIQIHDVIDTKHDDRCVECDILQSKAEDIVSKFLSTGRSESLKGDIAYLMLNNKKEDIIEKLVISIPYVIRNINWMNKFMKDCGGLKILMKMLKDKKNVSMQERCIKAICILATDNLKIKSPVLKKSKVKTATDDIRIGAYNPPDLTKSIVTFKLDDGSTINADRDILNEKSDYFNALLNGQFIESTQNEISLKNVRKQSLSCLLQLLGQVTINSKVSFQFDYDLDTILDVIVLSDRFLLSELNYYLVCHVEQLISMSTVPKFYKWAIESGTNIMRIESVAFALVGDISYKDRLNVFYTLFNLGYSVELIDDVEKLILQFL